MPSGYRLAEMLSPLADNVSHVTQVARLRHSQGISGCRDMSLVLTGRRSAPARGIDAERQFLLRSPWVPPEVPLSSPSCSQRPAQFRA